MVRNNLILCSVIALVTVNTASAASLGDFFNNLKKDVENVVQKTNRKNQDNSRENEETNTVAQTADRSDLTRKDNREIQQLLANAGYDPGPIDGLPGNKTKVAIQNYQAANSLPVSGEASLSLLAHLKKNKGTSARIATNVVKPTMSDSSAKASNQSTKVSISTASGNKYTPFGIPLGKPLSRQDFQMVGTKKTQDYQVSNYIVTPKKPHPLFKKYKITTNYKGTIVHAMAHNYWEGNQVANCYPNVESVANSLIKKYGKPRMYDKDGSTRLNIRNNSVNIVFRADCHAKRINLRFLDLSAQKAQSEYQAIIDKKKTKSVSKHNDVL